MTASSEHGTLVETRPQAGTGRKAMHPSRRRLAWIWTHRLGDWLRLQLWSWTL